MAFGFPPGGYETALEIPSDDLYYSAQFQIQDDNGDGVAFDESSELRGQVRATFLDSADLELKLSVTTNASDAADGKFTVAVDASTPTSGLDLSSYASQERVELGPFSVDIKQVGDSDYEQVLRGTCYILQHVEAVTT